MSSFDDDRHFTESRSKSSHEVCSLVTYRKCRRLDLLKHFWQAVDYKPEAVSCLFAVSLHSFTLYIYYSLVIPSCIWSDYWSRCHRKNKYLFFYVQAGGVLTKTPLVNNQIPRNKKYKHKAKNLIYWTTKERYHFGGVIFLSSRWKWIYGIRNIVYSHIPHRVMS